MLLHINWNAAQDTGYLTATPEVFWSKCFTGQFTGRKTGLSCMVGTFLVEEIFDLIICHHTDVEFLCANITHVDEIGRQHVPVGVEPVIHRLAVLLTWQCISVPVSGTLKYLPSAICLIYIADIHTV